jgi:Na+-transporting NADH:ubiquinone oxidoreductase subunit NqrF
MNANVLKLTLRVPKSTKFDFFPGQYINLIKNGVKRSYSIANMDENLIEFFIKNYENGLMSDFLFNKAKKEDMVLIEGPFGTFFLKDNSLENIIFFATGTGIAPIYSMLNNPDNLLFLKSKKIFLFHSNADILNLYEDLEENELIDLLINLESFDEITATNFVKGLDNFIDLFNELKPSLRKQLRLSLNDYKKKLEKIKNLDHKIKDKKVIQQVQNFFKNL